WGWGRAPSIAVSWPRGTARTVPRSKPDRDVLAVAAVPRFECRPFLAARAAASARRFRPGHPLVPQLPGPVAPRGCPGRRRRDGSCTRPDRWARSAARGDDRRAGYALRPAARYAAVGTSSSAADTHAAPVPGIRAGAAAAWSAARRIAV